MYATRTHTTLVTDPFEKVTYFHAAEDYRSHVPIQRQAAKMLAFPTVLSPWGNNEHNAEKGPKRKLWQVRFGFVAGRWSSEKVPESAGLSASSVKLSDLGGRLPTQIKGASRNSSGGSR